MILLPKIYSMEYGAEFPWAKDKDAISNAAQSLKTQ